MENFIIKKIDSSNMLLLCLGYNSVLSYIQEVAENEYIKSNEGKLIIDQILAVGDGENRFIVCEFSRGHIFLHAAKQINKDSTLAYKKISSVILRQYSTELEYSILTDNQRELLSRGQSI